MLSDTTPRATEDSEELRAFLQTRLALFWKVMFVIMVLATALGIVGAFKKPGPDLLLDIALAIEAGAFWWLCRTGQRSIRFSRTIELAGMLIYFTGASMIGRLVLPGFVEERSLTTAEGTLMADAYLSTLGMIGASLMISVRAAVIPSSPRRTLLYTAMVGVPVLATPTFLVPDPQGGFAIRAFDSEAFPWLPMGLAIAWSFVIITSAAISQVIYGLRAEVREARRLGQYVLEEKIGEGGMGEVYRARHGMMRRPSALKLLLPDHARQRDLARFEREVQLTSRLTHPNTITIFDYGRTSDGVFYYAMELLDGATLQRMVEVFGPAPEGRVVRLLTMACGALIEAHGVGLIHRDIKPANIMLCTQGGERDVVKLLDFGLVKELSVEVDVTASTASTLTGTPLYMAPESITSPSSVDARTDLYALGAVAYFLLTGGEVFTGATLVEVCSQHLHQQPDPMAARGVRVCPELEAIVLACLEKNPDRRPQSALELRRRLEACPVTPWDSDAAQAWWAEHEPALSTTPNSSKVLTRTVAIDRHSRAV